MSTEPTTSNPRPTREAEAVTGFNVPTETRHPTMDASPSSPGRRGLAADRPAEPDHPMLLDGALVPGDLMLMVRCMLEEMLQVGLSPAELADMSRDENYQALFAARRSLGDSHFDELLDQIVRRVGRHRYRTVEATGDVQGVALSIGQTR